jgi:hypothetical protein
MHIQSRTDSDNINGTMAMAMIAMMIVLVIVNIVPEALNQVDSVCQHSCKTFQQLIDVHRPNASRGKLNPHDVCISPLQLSINALLCSHQADSEGGYKTCLQAEYQAGFRLDSDKVFKCPQAL